MDLFGTKDHWFMHRFCGRGFITRDLAVGIGDYYRVSPPHQRELRLCSCGFGS